MGFETDMFHTSAVRRKWRHLYLTLAILWVGITDLLYEYLSVEPHPIDRILTTGIQACILIAGYVFVLRHLSNHFARSELMYQKIIEFSPQPLFVQSNYRWVYANPAALHLVGASEPEEVIGHAIWEIIHPDDWDAVKDFTEELYQNRVTSKVLVERKLIQRNGNIINVELRAAPMNMGGQRGIQAVFTDVTERKRIEQERDEALAKLQAFLENNTDAILLFDGSGIVNSMNSQFEKLYGINRTDWVGHSWNEASFDLQGQSSTTQLLFERILQRHTISDYRTVIILPTAETLHVSVSAFHFHNASGGEIGYAVTCRDISHETASEAHLARSEKLAAIGEIAAGVAHEIRNPLTSVLGFLKLVSEPANDKYKDYFDLMSSELQRISSIVNEMLILAKPQADTFELTNLYEVLRDTTNLLSSEALKYDCELISNLDAISPSLLVWGNMSRLKQLFINLIRNGIDAVKNSSAKVLAINCYLQDENVLIQVKDTGCGMSQEQLEHLTEPFYTTKQQGTGLGLHICQKIVDEHAGRLWFETSPGSGTTASIILPLGQDSPGPMRPQAFGRHQAYGTTPGNPCRILDM